MMLSRFSLLIFIVLTVCVFGARGNVSHFKRQQTTTSAATPQPTPLQDPMNCPCFQNDTTGNDPMNCSCLPEDPCAYHRVPRGSKGLHIGSLFMVLFAGLAGAAIPLVANRWPKLMPHRMILLVGKHMGTGVLISLALIHLLTPSMEALSDPCLPKTFSKNYSFAPLFALIAILAMHLIETTAHMWLEAKMHDPAQDSSGSSSSGDIESHEGHSHGLLLGKDGERTISAYVLEFGLASHSIIIGVTLGVATKRELSTLIPALCVHQFFEGFALGARLADVGFSRCTEIALGLIYSLSAPLGIALGIGIYHSYNPSSNTAHLVEGTFDSISAGILLYVGLVQMLAVDFQRDLKQSTKGFWRRFALYASIWVGAGIMAAIGRWL